MAERKIKQLPRSTARLREALLRAGIEPAPEQVNVDISIAIIPRVPSSIDSQISEIASYFFLHMINAIKK